MFLYLGRAALGSPAEIPVGTLNLLLTDGLTVKDRFRACAEALDLKYLTCPVVGACVEAVFLRQPPLSGRALEPGSDDKSDANPDDVPERSQGATHDLQSWLRRPITPRPVELQCEA